MALLRVERTFLKRDSPSQSGEQLSVSAYSGLARVWVMITGIDFPPIGFVHSVSVSAQGLALNHHLLFLQSIAQPQ